MRHTVVRLEVDPHGVLGAGDGGGHLLPAPAPQPPVPGLRHLEEVVAAVPGAVVVLHLKVGEGQVDRVTHRSLDGPRAVPDNKGLNIIETQNTIDLDVPEGTCLISFQFTGL